MSCGSDRALVVPWQSDNSPDVTVAWVTCCPVSTKRRDCHESRWVLAWSHSSVGRGSRVRILVRYGNIFTSFHLTSLTVFFKDSFFKDSWFLQTQVILPHSMPP